MKAFLFFLVTLSFATSSHASALWEQILDCDNGAAIVDRNVNYAYGAQVVIRDRKIIDYLAKHDIHPNAQAQRYGRTEIIIQGTNSQPITSPARFIDIRDGDFQNEHFASRRGNGLLVSFVRWQTPRNGQWSGSYQEIANWHFRDCR